jgi:hypothetical protein
MPQGPNFICPGPEKTGTTWLYHNLNKHPEIHLNKLKEIRYFYEKYAFKGERWPQRYFGSLDWHRENYRTHLKIRLRYFRQFPRAIIKEWDEIIWDFRYLFTNHNDKRYLKLLTPKNNLISGDISPQYFFLPLEEIIKIKEILPTVKIIIILRDPLTWIWSFYRMLLQLENKKVSDISEEEMLRSIENRFSNLMYSPAVNNWISVFGKENVYISFFERLSNEPKEIFKEVCNFLEIDYNKYPDKQSLVKKVYEGKPDKMPDFIKNPIINKYYNDITQLAKAFNTYPSNWLKNYDKTINSEHQTPNTKHRTLNTEH